MAYDKKFVDKSKCAKYREPIKIAEGFISVYNKPRKVIIYDTFIATVNRCGGHNVKVRKMLNDLGIDTRYNSDGYARLVILKDAK